jgi:hypothetical protein
MSAPRAITALALAVTLASGCAREADLAAVDLFAAANLQLAQATTADDCRAAAARYEQLLAQGGENGAVLHALGNAWFRAGEKGRAIAAWRQALLHRPRDPGLRANLAQARVGLPPQESPLIDELLFWRDDLAYGEQAWLLTGSVALACVARLLARRGARLGAAASSVAWSAGVIAAVAALAFARTVVEVEFTRHGAVAAAELVVRKGDAESFEPALTEPLRDGCELRVVGERGGWLEVELAGGLSGWVQAARVVTW